MGGLLPSHGHRASHAAIATVAPSGESVQPVPVSPKYAVLPQDSSFDLFRPRLVALARRNLTPAVPAPPAGLPDRSIRPHGWRAGG